MSETYVWTETRLRAIELFRDAPSAALEQRILDVFLEHPVMVVEAVEHVGRRFERGQVRSPWAILAKHVSEAVRPLDDVTATDERDRDKAIRRAEQWIRAAGKHFDRVEEVLEELFGELGRIRSFDSPQLRERMAKVWREVRSEGELIEEQHEQRAQAYIKANGQVIGAEGRPVTPPPWRLGKIPAKAYVVAPGVSVEPGMEDEPAIDEEPALA